MFMLVQLEMPHLVEDSSGKETSESNLFYQSGPSTKDETEIAVC